MPPKKKAAKKAATKAAPVKLPTPRVEVFEGRNGLFYMRLVKRGGKITEHGAGGRANGYTRSWTARRQAKIDHPTIPIVMV